MRLVGDRQIHVKTAGSQKLRMFLNVRKFLQTKPAVFATQFSPQADKFLAASHLAATIIALSKVRRALPEQYQRLYKAMERMAADDGICRLLIAAPTCCYG